MHYRAGPAGAPLKTGAIFWLCVAGLLALCVLSLGTGTVTLGPRAAWDGLLGRKENLEAYMIMRYARLPRLLITLTVGGALAAAGLLTQTLFRNPLATPSVLGIGNGANLGLLAAVVLAPDLTEATAVMACFAGAVASALLVAAMGAATQSKMDRDSLIVGGTMLAALEASLVVAILFFHGLGNTMLGWTLGRLTQVDWSQISLTLPLIMLGLAAAFVLAPQLEAFLLGDSIAASLGVRVRSVEMGAMATIVVLAAAAVAAAGPVPYVGLIVPHILTRKRVPSARWRLAVCCLGGALLTGFAELLSRFTSQKQIVPLGIWTMAAGAAFFFALSLTRKERTA